MQNLQHTARCVIKDFLRKYYMELWSVCHVRDSVLIVIRKLYVMSVCLALFWYWLPIACPVPLVTVSYVRVILVARFVSKATIWMFWGISVYLVLWTVLYVSVNNYVSFVILGSILIKDFAIFVNKTVNFAHHHKIVANAYKDTI